MKKEDNPDRNLNFDPERIAIGGRIEYQIETIFNPKETTKFLQNSWLIYILIFKLFLDNKI